MKQTSTLAIFTGALIFLNLLACLQVLHAQDVVPSATCANAPNMNLPDAVMPYCSSLTDGMVFQGAYKLDSISGNSVGCNTTYAKGSVWYQFTVPANKGINGFLLSVPLQKGCTTCVDQPFIANLYKGSACNNLDFKGAYQLNYCVTADQRGFYKNEVLLYDSASGNETYYLNLVTDSIANNKSINPGIKWIGEPVKNDVCSRSELLSSNATESCNKIIPIGTAPQMANTQSCSATGPGAGSIYNPVYYSFIPKAPALSVVIKATNCYNQPPILYAFVYKNCDKVGTPEIIACASTHYSYNTGDSVKIDLANLTVDSTYILVIDPQQPAPGFDFLPSEAGRCGLSITVNGNILLSSGLSTLSAQLNHDLRRVDLTWKASANSGSIFLIERSKNVKEFEPIGSMRSNANTTYSYADDSYYPVRSYYRVKELTKDGRELLSSIQVVNTNKNLEQRYYPNPVNNQLTIEMNLDKAQQRRITITDISGKIVQRQNVFLNAGLNTISINTSSLSKGNYILVSEGEKNLTIKFQKN